MRGASSLHNEAHHLAEQERVEVEPLCVDRRCLTHRRSLVVSVPPTAHHPAAHAARAAANPAAKSADLSAAVTEAVLVVALGAVAAQQPHPLGLGERAARRALRRNVRRHVRRHVRRRDAAGGA
eukprot:2789349-Pleurochrysis_carterae.AAC.1